MNGLSTLVVIDFPDALTMDFTGDDPNMKFHLRIVDDALVTSYSVVGMHVYDAVVQRVRAWRGRRDRIASCAAVGTSMERTQ